MTVRFRLVRAVLAGGLVASGLFSGVGAVVAAPALSMAVGPVATLPADVNTDALQRVGACIAGGGQGDMLLLIDRSGSLRTSDPKGARVDAAKYLVRQMSSFGASAKANLTIAIAGFDQKYDKTTDWTALTPANLGPIETALEGYRSQVGGIDTDYWNALTGARKDLAARAGGAPGHCSFVVWFTDGAYDLSRRAGRSDEDRRALGDPKPYAADKPLETDQDARAVIAAGAADLCRPGGVADQLRSQGIVNIGVGLGGDPAPDFTALKSIATGEGGCGKIVSPAPGAFFLANDIDALFFAFDQFATPGRSPQNQTASVCGVDVCAEGTHSFVLDPAISAVHLLGASSTRDQRVVLVNPSGQQTEIVKGREGSVSVPGAQLVWRWVSEQSASIDLRRTDDAAWTGQWGLVFLSPSRTAGTSRSSLHIFGDLVPAWRESGKSLTAGQAATLSFGVTHSDGSPVELASLSDSTTLSAVLELAEGKQVQIATRVPRGQIGDPQRIDLTGVAPGSARLRVSLEVTTRPWNSPAGTVVPGTKLEPQVKDFLLQIASPPNYPVVPDQVDFGKSESAGPVSTQIPVTGEGCVWLVGSSSLTLPQGVDSVSVTSNAIDRASCVSGPLVVTVTGSAVGNGLASGTLKVATAPKGDGAPIERPVTYRWDVSRPLNIKVLLPVLIGVTLLGLAIPLGLIYLVKYLTATIPGDALKVGSVRGRVDGSGSFLDEGVDLEPSALPAVFLASNRRVVQVGDKRLLTKAGWALTEPGFVVVEQPGTPAGAGRTAMRHKGQAKLPLSLVGSWCVALDAVNPHEGDVEVTIFTNPAGSKWSDLVEELRRDVRDAVEILRAQLPATGSTSGAAPDAWGNSAPAADPWAAPAEESPDPWGTNRTQPRSGIGADLAGGGSPAPPSAPPPSSAAGGAAPPAGPAPSPDTW